MSDRQLDEKTEEKNEKDREKQEEKTVEEKWRRDPLSAVVWAAIFIWAGLVLLASNAGLLSRLSVIHIPGMPDFVARQLDAWPLILIGAGVIVLVEVVIRLVVPAYRQNVVGSIIFAFILIGIGVSNWTGWEVVWPLVLIAIGLSFILGGIFRKR